MKKALVVIIILILGCSGFLYYDWHTKTHKQAAEPSIAQYAWTDAQGTRHFTDTAPPAGATNIEKTKGYKVSSMLEVTAGQGSSIGYRFEHLREIINLVEEKERMSVCIDTAHIFAAGYDIKDQKNYKKVIKDFDEIIGLERLKCFHINDSKKELGSRVDRHAHIGKGFIGLEGFTNIMNDKRLEKIPKILETPKGKEQLEDLENLEVLKSLIKK